ncbi:MFS transporter (plasmid) [Bacillaceae bacterium JMAK1]|nr:MFS transporter [Bacillaceae bacterium JMAK1]
MKRKVSLWCIISLATIPLVMTLSNSMLIPILPTFERELGITPLQSSMIITSFSVSSVFLIPIAGYLSDRLGRKKVIVPSLLITIIGSLIAAISATTLSNSYLLIIIGRVIQGAGAAGALPIVIPLVGDIFQNDDDHASSTLGLIETSNTFGKVISPILGAGLATIVWFIPFYVAALLAIIAVTLVILTLHPPNKNIDFQKQNPPRSRFLQSTKTVFNKNRNWLFTVFFTGGFTMLLLFALQFFLSDHLEKTFAVQNIRKGLLLAIPLLFLCGASFFSGRLINGDLKRMKWMMVLSLSIILLSSPLVGFVKESLFWLLTTVSIIGVSIGAILPALDAFITENIEKESRGLITSFYSSARFTGVAAGPPLMAILLNHVTITFGVVSLLIIVNLIIVIKFINSEKTKKKAS